MWYRYATINGIHDFSKPIVRKTKQLMNSNHILPPLHDNCKCKIIKKNNGLYQWINEFNPCKQCLESQYRFNLEQQELFNASKKPIENNPGEIVNEEPVIDNTVINENPEFPPIENIEEEPETITNEEEPEIIKEPELVDVEPQRYKKRRRHLKPYLDFK